MPALERAVNEIRRRHDVLRANFEFVADQPMQIVAPFQPVPLTVVDCSDLPDDQRKSVRVRRRSTTTRGVRSISGTDR